MKLDPDHRFRRDRGERFEKDSDAINPTFDLMDALRKLAEMDRNKDQGEGSPTDGGKA